MWVFQAKRRHAVKADPCLKVVKRLFTFAPFRLDLSASELPTGWRLRLGAMFIARRAHQ
jgi:hypothetical protein